MINDTNNTNNTVKMKISIIYPVTGARFNSLYLMNKISFNSLTFAHSLLYI